MADLAWQRGLMRLWLVLSLAWATWIVLILYEAPDLCAWFIGVPVGLAWLALRALFWIVRGFGPYRG